MSMAQSKFVPYAMKKSIVRVYDYEDMNISGILINPFLPEDVHFRSTIQLLKLIGHIQDSLNFPQQSMLPRSFSGGSEKEAANSTASSAASPKQSALASFEINILFRQNASWQGSIVWMEKAISAEFRSVLELIHLFDDVLSDLSQDNKIEVSTA